MGDNFIPYLEESFNILPRDFYVYCICIGCKFRIIHNCCSYNDLLKLSFCSNFNNIVKDINQITIDKSTKIINFIRYDEYFIL